MGVGGGKGKREVLCMNAKMKEVMKCLNVCIHE